MVESDNPASLMVSWDPPVRRDRNGDITGYVIQYTVVGSSDMMNMNVVGDTRLITIPELVAYVNYSVIVAAMTVNGTGPFSDPPVVGRSGEDGELHYITTLLCSCMLLYVVVCFTLIVHTSVTVLRINFLIYILLYRTNVWREKSLVKMLQISFWQKSLAN